MQAAHVAWAYAALTGMLVQECERAAFLLSGLARLAGQWQAALPGCIAAVRRSAAAFAALAALPSVKHSLYVHCEPVSPEEKVSQPLVCLLIPDMPAC